MPSDVRLAEVQKLLASAGYNLERIRGSHHIFGKPGALPVSIPVHRGKVKAFYVRQIEKIIQGN